MTIFNNTAAINTIVTTVLGQRIIIHDHQDI